jgi:hypothetical protein
MKLSQNTLSLLQSFASINANLHVKPGNKLITRNATGSAQARAVVDETFPVQFAIYDLNQLLGLLSISGDSDVMFGEKSLVIKSPNGGELEYYYADPSLVTAPPDTELQIDGVFTFTIPAGDVNVVHKTSNLVSATTLTFVCDGGDVTMKINDPKNTTSNTYKKIVGTCDRSFAMKMSVDNFRSIVPDSYEVQIGIATGRGGARVPVFTFNSTSRKLTYLIAADPTSKI